MCITLQVVVSALIVAAVLWWMWRLPRRDDAMFAWAPPLALLSAWCGVLSLIGSACLWVVPYPDNWITILFLLLDPAAIASGTLVLWIYRGGDRAAATIQLQRM